MRLAPWEPKDRRTLTFELDDMPITILRNLSHIKWSKWPLLSGFCETSPSRLPSSPSSLPLSSSTNKLSPSLSPSLEGEIPSLSSLSGRYHNDHRRFIVYVFMY